MVSSQPFDMHGSAFLTRSYFHEERNQILYQSAHFCRVGRFLVNFSIWEPPKQHLPDAWDFALPKRPVGGSPVLPEANADSISSPPISGSFLCSRPSENGSIDAHKRLRQYDPRNPPFFNAEICQKWFVATEQ